MKVDSRHPFHHFGESLSRTPIRGRSPEGRGSTAILWEESPRPIFIPLRGLRKAIGESGIVPH